MPKAGNKPGPRGWLPSSLARLGKLPDKMLAAALGRSLAEVRAMREKMGLPPAGRPSGYFVASARATPRQDHEQEREPESGAFRVTQWRRWELDLLGKYADEAVAKRTGRSLMAVKIQRNQLGRRAPGVKVRLWSAEEIALFETATLAEIAAKTGRPLKAVKLYGRKFFPEKIQLFIKIRRWKPEELALLKTHSETEVARITGRPLGAVISMRKHHRIPRHL